MARILIAIDFSECGRLALKAGIQLALDLHSDVRLVHAFPNPMQPPVAMGLGYQEIFEKYASQNDSTEAIRLTQEYADRARDAGLDVDIVASSGKPEKIILAAAEDSEVALVVVGSHGKSGFKKLMIGSVAQKVVQHATKPTLVIPGK